MTLDEMLGRIYASMPDIGTMADPIKRNPIVQNIARNVGEVRDFAAGSRGAGSGTRNYVNFSADDILALTRNGVSIP